ncbi:hypothetical protein BDR22DRAFT_870007 [Usnea florida]
MKRVASLPYAFALLLQKLAATLISHKTSASIVLWSPAVRTILWMVQKCNLPT